MTQGSTQRWQVPVISQLPGDVVRLHALSSPSRGDQHGWLWIDADHRAHEPGDWQRHLACSAPEIDDHVVLRQP
jgi:hypothetical protein